MPAESPGLTRYRRILAAAVLLGAVGVAVAGALLAWRGEYFRAFLALCIVAFLVALRHGYRQDERDRG